MHSANLGEISSAYPDPELDHARLADVIDPSPLSDDPTVALGQLEAQWKAVTVLLLDAAERRHPGILALMEKVGAQLTIASRKAARGSA